MPIPWTWVDTASAVMFACQAILPPLALLLALSGLDDLFIDFMFALRSLARRKWRSHAVAASQIASGASPQPIAVLIPAWDESAIIGDMLDATLARWKNEPAIRLFVGWYANDQATGREIALAAIQDARVIPVVVPHDGPTTKADCLNHLWAAARQYAASRGQIWSAFLLHDAEDLVSTSEPAVIRHMIHVRGKSLVQFPVVPVPVPGSPFISGHYLDEFAESHTKDMAVREWMGAPLPAAGVGCAFASNILETIAVARGGLPFNTASLTEDYELGLLVSRSRAAAFVRIASQPHESLVATREHFPDLFWSAVRQKSRWLTGIALTGWDRFGWRGTFAHKYWLARDRKAIFAFYLNASAYCLAAVWLSLLTWQFLDPVALHFSSDGIARWIAPLLVLNSLLLVWRLFMRALFVAHLSGPVQALLSVPRAFVGNIINICAAFHAIGRFVRSRFSRHVLTWDKTSHRFPFLTDHGS